MDSIGSEGRKGVMLPRFFVDPSDIEPTSGGFQARVAGEDAHHLKNVLRLSVGDELWICDGKCRDYSGRIARVEQGAVIIELKEPTLSKGEPPITITLFQSLPKADKMDFVVQKATEIGVTEIVPIESERSVVNLNPSKAENRLNRWRRISRSAAEQAGRGIIPEIKPILRLEEALNDWRKNNPEGLLLVPWEEEKAKRLKEIIGNNRASKTIGILIGPEGGLSTQEVSTAYNLSGQICSLGPRILRTETAGTVTAALVLYELGDMGGDGGC
jgi:16S rRNA (uracil1498-N3)-methyltransferase